MSSPTPTPEEGQHNTGERNVLATTAQPWSNHIRLTLLWLLCFVLACLLLLSYGLMRDGEHHRYLTFGEALSLFPGLLALYSAYIGGILAFWYVRPFPRITSHGADRFRFFLAVLCTIMFNGFVVGALSAGYWNTDGVGSLDNLMEATLRVAKEGSWVVAPVMAFYFGCKESLGT